MSDIVRVERLKLKQARERAAFEAFHDILNSPVLANPLFAGLGALAANQLAYKAGLWDPRPWDDGRYYRRVTTGPSFDFQWFPPKITFDPGGDSWQAVDKEEIASGTASTIGFAILAGMLVSSGATGLASVANLIGKVVPGQ